MYKWRTILLEEKRYYLFVDWAHFHFLSFYVFAIQQTHLKYHKTKMD